MVKDTNGAPAQPYRSVDTVEMLLRRGSITREMTNAADEFRRAFRLACFDPLRAADLSRVPKARGRGDGTGSTWWARQRVQDALGALGGVARVPGSCAWHILGLEWSLKPLARASSAAIGTLPQASSSLPWRFLKRTPLAGAPILKL
jgi:hypothetical protein